ncbi:helicase-exonuclease AddAB subunit AddA [Enterococcus alishanensis]
MSRKIPIPERTADVMFTEQQWQAIYDQGDNILVSASAGSGKTAVLVRRVIEKIRQQNFSVDDLLVVTFTEAAAAEMKERIQQAIQQAAEEAKTSEERNYFNHQLSKLPMANISTLHAFCAKVIQRFFYLIDLDPNYRMLTDETETILLKEEVWDSIRELNYEKKEVEFYRLTENFSSDRDDRGLENLIFSMYNFARSNSEPEKWLDSLLENYQFDGEFAHSKIFTEQLRPMIVTELDRVIENYQLMIQRSQAIGGLTLIIELAEDELNHVLTVKEALLKGDLAIAYQVIQATTFKTFPSTKKEIKAVKEAYPEEFAEIQNLRNLNKDQLQKNILPNYFSEPFEIQGEILKESEKLVSGLIEVEKAFIQQFSERKMSKNLLDFNDLEHFALKILETEIDGAYPAKNYYRTQFKEVLVDEYQDINQLQETILQAVSQEHPGNMFMVGDVKQSIYGFRLADPTLFIEKYESYQNDVDFDGNRKIILPDNFRSRKEVLDFTNLIFKQIMDKELGQIEYGSQEELIAGSKAFPESDHFSAELLIAEQKVEEDDLIDESATAEIYLVANKIREMKDQKFQIFDKKMGIDRALDYRDIVLLTPTRKNHLTIIDVFKKMGIPLNVNDAQNYFQTTELRIIVALMQIIDNPFQDIPLAAVLRSPITDLDDQELATIRLKMVEGDFFTAIKNYQVTEEDKISQKLAIFLNQLDNWRELSHRTSMVDLLLNIYQETAYLDYVLGMPAGQQRHANLLALVERAKDYEKSSYRGLYQFIRFIEKMQEKSKDLAEPPATETGDAVTVMTIHASKGLEFPVVFLLNSSRKANLSDLRNKYIFDEHAGIGIKYLDPFTRVNYITIAFKLIAKKKNNKLLSEEMRKLYVALTRAEQKLFIVGSYDSQEAALKKWQLAATNEDIVLDTAIRNGQGVFLDWIGQSLFRHATMENYQQQYPINQKNSLYHHPAKFKITFANAQEIAQTANSYQPVFTKVKADDQEIDVSQILQQAGYQYIFPEATKTTNYQSVSEIKRLYDDPDNREVLDISDNQNLNQNRYRFTENQLPEPRFLVQTDEISSAEIGTATHLVMQLIDVSTQPTEKSVRVLIESLIAQKSLSQELADSLSIENILTFFETDLGKKLLATPDLLHREEPFAMLLSADEIFKDYRNNDEILIHGIIDGYLEYPNEIILYDFKTDYYSESREQELINRYKGQLTLYKEALEKAKQKKVSEINLVFLRGNKIINLL